LPTLTSVSDAASLTWNLRGTKTYTCTDGASCGPGAFGSGAQANVYWYSAPAASLLSSDTISVAFAGATGGNARWTLTAVAISGVANLAAPFDPDPSLPAYNEDMSATLSQPTVSYATAIHPLATVNVDGVSSTWGANGDAFAGSNANLEITTCFDWHAGGGQCTAAAAQWKNIVSVGGTPTALLSTFYKADVCQATRLRPQVWIAQ
jgi:hypothetical protein